MGYLMKLSVVKFVHRFGWQSNWREHSREL